MQAFMLYMSGGGVQIFSMGIVFMLLMTPFKNVLGMNEGEFGCGSRCWLKRCLSSCPSVSVSGSVLTTGLI